MIAEILIVDDNSDIRNILKDLILDAGFKTRVAANYKQALKEIDTKLPDVAILDVKLDTRKTKSLDPNNKVLDSKKLDVVSEPTAENPVICPFDEFKLAPAGKEPDCTV